MGAQKNRLIETVLLSTHNIRFWLRNKKIFVTYSLTKSCMSAWAINEDFIRKCDKYQNRGAGSLKEQITLYDQ